MILNDNVFDNSIAQEPTIKSREINSAITIAIKERKERADKGANRGAYKQILPKRYREYLNRANKKGLPFELTIDEFNHVLSLDCVYCGSSSRMTIDRIDSKCGYTIDNSQPCCFLCNIMKYTHSEHEFLRQITKIYKHIQSKQSF